MGLAMIIILIVAAVKNAPDTRGPVSQDMFPGEKVVDMSKYITEPTPEHTQKAKKWPSQALDSDCYINTYQDVSEPQKTEDSGHSYLPVLEAEIKATKEKRDRLQREYDAYLEEQAENQRKYNEYADELADVEKQIQIMEQMFGVSTQNVKADPKEIGNAFESFVADLMTSQGFRLIEWNQGQTSAGGAWAEDSLKPDFRVSIEEKGLSLEFWIECKYRSKLPEKSFNLPQYQLERYLDFQKSMHKKVLLLLGVCCTPDDPGTLYLIPVEYIKKYNGIRRDFFSAYQLDKREDLRGRIAQYFFNVVFRKPRQGRNFSKN